MPLEKDLMAFSQTRVPLWPRMLWSSQKPHWVRMFSGSPWVALKPATRWNSTALREKLRKGMGNLRVLPFSQYTSTNSIWMAHTPTSHPIWPQRWGQMVYRVELRTAAQKLAFLEYIRRKTNPKPLCVAQLPRLTQALGLSALSVSWMCHTHDLHHMCTCMTSFNTKWNCENFGTWLEIGCPSIVWSK